MNVLIVEDERRIADFLAKGLRRQGYEVDCVYSGRKHSSGPRRRATAHR
jgi:DNA-binding response OmpR family regulator